MFSGTVVLFLLFYSLQIDISKGVIEIDINFTRPYRIARSARFSQGCVILQNLGTIFLLYLSA